MKRGLDPDRRSFRAPRTGERTLQKGTTIRRPALAADPAVDGGVIEP